MYLDQQAGGTSNRPLTHLLDKDIGDFDVIFYVCVRVVVRTKFRRMHLGGSCRCGGARAVVVVGVFTGGGYVVIFVRHCQEVAMRQPGHCHKHFCEDRVFSVLTVMGLSCWFSCWFGLGMGVLIVGGLVALVSLAVVLASV